MPSSISGKQLSRIPVRPLSIDKKSLREAKELLINYEIGALYLSDKDKNLINITASAEMVIDKVLELLYKDKELLSNILMEIIGEDGEKILKPMKDVILECIENYGVLSIELRNLTSYIDTELVKYINNNKTAINAINGKLEVDEQNIQKNSNNISKNTTSISNLSKKITIIESLLNEISGEDGTISIISNSINNINGKLEELETKLRNQIYITTKEFSASDPNIPNDALIYVQVES